MSKHMTFFASLVLAAGVTLTAAGSAQARHWGWGWGPYLYYGWPYGGYSFYVPRPYYYAPTYYAPTYYAPPPRCAWVNVRGWRNGHRVWRRAWRCW